MTSPSPERRVAGVSLRLWGLILNLLGNVLLVHGAVRYVAAGTNFYELVAGVVMTVLCVVALSIPNR
ncbi:MAG: hypothetical protein ACREON_02695 [Gemmatimonadaceae bacterium]